MLGDKPRLPHGTMRWLIIVLMVINGLQLVLLQATINGTLSLDFAQVWIYVGLSFAALLLALGLIGYAFLRSQGSGPQR